MKKLLWFLLGMGLLTAPVYGQVVSGTISTAATTCTGTSCVSYILPGGAIGTVGSVAIQIVGSMTGTLQFEGAADAAGTVKSINCFPTSSSSPATAATAAGLWQCSVTGLNLVQVRASGLMAGTPVVTIRPSAPGIGSGGGSPPATVVASCGAETLTPGDPSQVLVDISGVLCSSATLSGNVTIGSVAILSVGSANATVPGSINYIGFKDSTGKLQGATVTVYGSSSAVDVNPVGPMIGTLADAAVTPGAAGSFESQFRYITNALSYLQTGVPVIGSGPKPVTGALATIICGTAGCVTPTNEGSGVFGIPVHISSSDVSFSISGVTANLVGTTNGGAIPGNSFMAGFSDGTNQQQVARVYDADTGGGTHYAVETVIMQPGAGGPTPISFVTDAANQTPVSSPPVPGGCVYYSGGNTLADTQIGYFRCTTASELVVKESDLAGPIATGQKDVTTAATLVVMARAGRAHVLLTNITGSDDVYCDGTGALTAGPSGNSDMSMLGAKGSSDKMDTAGPVYCRVATTTQRISYREEF